MQAVKFQLSTPAAINRDIRVEVTNEASGQKTEVTPFLDGTVKVNNLAPGPYRVTVTHPNIPAFLYDDRIRVFPDRPTFVPIRIPTDLFSDAPIRDTPLADLKPARDALTSVADRADRQAKKKGGQPIFADDWNDISDALGDLSRATVDLSQRVSPDGHDHPELADKIAEVQSNLLKFFDLFGKTVVELQRQLQQLALQRRVDDALAAVPVATPADSTRVSAAREAMTKAVTDLQDLQGETSYAYTSQVRRTGERLAETIDTLIPPDKPELRNDPAISAAANVAFALSSQTPATNYSAELALHQRVDAQSGKSSITLALGSRQQKV